VPRLTARERKRCARISLAMLGKTNAAKDEHKATLNATLAPALKTGLQQEAREQGVTVSALVSALVESYLREKGRLP
jgi:lambda repressor-like predicted transcriptional regulator